MAEKERKRKRLSLQERIQIHKKINNMRKASTYIYLHNNILKQNKFGS